MFSYYRYKNYEILWEGLAAMPRSFREKYMVLLVGDGETTNRGIEGKRTHSIVREHIL